MEFLTIDELMEREDSLYEQVMDNSTLQSLTASAGVRLESFGFNSLQQRAPIVLENTEGYTFYNLSGHDVFYTRPFGGVGCVVTHQGRFDLENLRKHGAGEKLYQFFNTANKNNNIVIRVNAYNNNYTFDDSNTVDYTVLKTEDIHNLKTNGSFRRHVFFISICPAKLATFPEGFFLKALGITVGLDGTNIKNHYQRRIYGPALKGSGETMLRFRIRSREKYRKFYVRMGKSIFPVDVIPSEDEKECIEVIYGSPSISSPDSTVLKEFTLKDALSGPTEFKVGDIFIDFSLFANTADAMKHKDFDDSVHRKTIDALRKEKEKLEKENQDLRTKNTKVQDGWFTRVLSYVSSIGVFLLRWLPK